MFIKKVLMKEIFFSSYGTHCDDCGKERKGPIWRYTHHFWTMDGGDSMDYTECLTCHIKNELRSIRRRLTQIPHKVKTFTENWSYLTKLPWYSVKRMKLAKSLVKKG